MWGLLYVNDKHSVAKMFSSLLIAISLASLIRALPSPNSSFAPQPTDLQDRYIITLNPSSDLSHHLTLAQSLAHPSFEGTTHIYNLTSFQGYAGHFSPSAASLLGYHPDVLTFEPDQVFTLPSLPLSPTPDDESTNPSALDSRDAIHGFTKGGPSLASISQRTVLQNPTRNPIYWASPSLGFGTTIYILDSGIKTSHPDFQSRARNGYNALNPRQTIQDETGHGTHIAGIVGGRTYGVAKRASLIGVKVVDAKRQLRTSWVLDGLRFAVQDIHDKRSKKLAVVHVSVYMHSSPAWEIALRSSFDQGVTVVLPAGYEGKDDSARLTRVAPHAIVVSAADAYRKKPFWANWGRGIAVHAPGVAVMSSSLKSPEGETMSGSAQAAAFVSGMVGYFKGLPDVLMTSPTAVKAYLNKNAVPEAVELKWGPKRKWAYNGSGR